MKKLNYFHSFAPLFIMYGFLPSCLLPHGCKVAAGAASIASLQLCEQGKEHEVFSSGWRKPSKIFHRSFPKDFHLHSFRQNYIITTCTCKGVWENEDLAKEL
jgi:hypothetical protein